MQRLTNEVNQTGLNQRCLAKLDVSPGCQDGWLMMTRSLAFLGKPPRTVLNCAANGHSGPEGVLTSVAPNFELDGWGGRSWVRLVPEFGWLGRIRCGWNGHTLSRP